MGLTGRLVEEGAVWPMFLSCPAFAVTGDGVLDTAPTPGPLLLLCVSRVAIGTGCHVGWIIFL